jgi:peptidoglycan/LPS O-acetylase OafA/YrhL
MFFFNHIATCPFLIGLVPIILARTWRARRVAILFGLGSVGLWLYFILIHKVDVGAFEGFWRFVLPIFGALIIAIISAFVTYRIDKKSDHDA